MNKISLNMKNLNTRDGVGPAEMPRELICPLMAELYMWYDHLVLGVKEKIAEIHADPYADAEDGGTCISLYLVSSEGQYAGLAINGDTDGIYEVRNTMDKLLVEVGLVASEPPKASPASLFARILQIFPPKTLSSQ